MQLSDLDRSVGVDGPSGVVGHFPHVAVRIRECFCRSSPRCLSGRSHDGPTGSFGIRQNMLHFVWGTDVVGEFDSGSAATTCGGPLSEQREAMELVRHALDRGRSPSCSTLVSVHGVFSPALHPFRRIGHRLQDLGEGRDLLCVTEEVQSLVSVPIEMAEQLQTEVEGDGTICEVIRRDEWPESGAEGRIGHMHCKLLPRGYSGRHLGAK